MDRKPPGAFPAVLVSISLAVAGLAGGCATDPEAAKPWIVKLDVPYGEHALQKLDLYRPEGDGPFPVILHIHGGGWWNGDKGRQNAGHVQRILGRGCAMVAINYRCLPQAQEAGLFPPVLGPFHDARRALQFVRHSAEHWRLDPRRVGLIGGSAGGCSALWLALSDDMAVEGDDPIAAQSTRVTAVATFGAQTSLDPKQMREWVGPELRYGGHAFGLPEPDFEQFLRRRAEFEEHFGSVSPAALLDRGDPPIFLFYGNGPATPKKDHMYYVHCYTFGVGFARLAEQVGADCTLAYAGEPEGAQRTDAIDFLLNQLGTRPAEPSTP